MSMSENDWVRMDNKFNSVYGEIKSVRLELKKPIEKNTVKLAQVEICAKTAKKKIDNHVTGHKGSLWRILTIISLTVGILVSIIILINNFT